MRDLTHTAGAGGSDALVVSIPCNPPLNPLTLRQQPLISQTAEDASKGQKQVQQAVTAINTVTVEITDSTQRVEAFAGQIHDITKALEVIRGIAEQTNLLALNAAIAAARTGEQGRDFAVVADEVRALAHRTQSSTGEIEAMIDRIRNGVDEAVHAM
ncbi:MULTISPECIES: methyl-accepting chemotaxis protein [Pseudomonas syringae group]|uniref:Methyl-accepting chemotaxis protein n=2 Tax=Pseudomonas TaxID=286 RepID=A0A0N8T541_PSESX|nr:Methyl-accepting chemotaxis protein [Pseudomonas syringae pv. spinaceae]KTB78486.1 hypothetical protein AO069_03425 [Pseudomonas syringae pv. syringae PD2774]KWS15107.1 hypothetical protein AL064_04635 [Pseudomonas syringae pv. syringae]KWS23037.1 hypothetical protein AL061_22605 [Pseudomonas syringae pv. syringae]KWS27327.1 hypothetical protein AL062_09490 [Pseudomonas syringae pv. syringae]